MKPRLILLLCLFSASMLAGQYNGNVKGGASVGWINGATLGLEFDSPGKPDRAYFHNLAFGKGAGFWSAGINIESRRFHSGHFYSVGVLGFDYVEFVDPFGDPGGSNAGGPERYVSTLLPHLSIGIGYETALSEHTRLYIEWDLGLKASISNINIGVVLDRKGK